MTVSPWSTPTDEDPLAPDGDGSLRMEVDDLPVAVVFLERRGDEAVLAGSNREAGRLLGRPLPPGEPIVPLLAAAGARHPAQGVLRRADVLDGFLAAGQAVLDELMWIEGEGGDQRAVRVTLKRMLPRRPFRIMVVMEDVTELTALERAQDAFAAAVSHELRTPLTALRGIGELLRMRGEQLSAEELADGLDRMLKETESLTRIVNELLDLTRIKLGLFEVEIGPVDLAETARAVAAGAPAGVEIEVDPLADHVLTDRRLLERALVLLVDNAVRHGAPPIVIRTLPEGGAVMVSVEDRGPGIPMEERRRLFVPFMKGLPRLGTGEGSGLGLALVQVLVSAMGGVVAYRDLPEGGASVSIVFGREYA